MKRLAIKMSRFMLILAVFFTIACNKQGMESAGNVISNDKNTVLGTSAVLSYDIYAGQSNLAGKLSVWNDHVNLYVRYDITAPHTLLDQVHLWVGTDILLVPQNNSGIPIPGQFPYQAENLNVTTYQFTLPLANILVNSGSYCAQNVYIFAHAALKSNTTGTGLGGETAWSYGTEFSTSRWGWYSNYSIACEWQQPPAEVKTSTAFAKFAKPEGRIFTTDPKSNPENYETWGITKNRWGWGMQTNLAATYSAELWAGAGLNNTSKGVKVGTAQLSLDQAGKVVVELFPNAGVNIQEVHIYAGNVQPVTVAPGQYGFIRSYQASQPQSFQYEFFLDSAVEKFFIIHTVVQH